MLWISWEHFINVIDSKVKSEEETGGGTTPAAAFCSGIDWFFFRWEIWLPFSIFLCFLYLLTLLCLLAAINKIRKEMTYGYVLLCELIYPPPCDTTYFLSDPTQSQTPAGIYWIPVLMDTNTWCIQKLSVLSEVYPVCFPGIMWLLLLCLDPLAEIDHYMRTLHANAYLATAMNAAYGNVLATVKETGINRLLAQTL